jgi:hypothetical protein
VPPSTTAGTRVVIRRRPCELSGQAQALDDVVAELCAGRHRIERADAHLLLDDVDADRVVGRRSRDGARLDREALTQQLDAAPRRDGIVRRQDHRGQRFLDVGRRQDRLDAVRAEDPVAEFEHNDIGPPLCHLAQHRTRERGPGRGGCRDDAKVREDHAAARPGVLHRKDVAAQRDTGRFERVNGEAAVPHAAHDRARGRGLAGLHAGARKRDDRHAARVELCGLLEPAVADAGRHADALAEVRELQHAPDHATVERLALFRVRGVADADHAADVQHLRDVTGLTFRARDPSSRTAPGGDRARR